MSTIKQENFYPHPAERVWRALTDSEAMNAWLMENDFKPVVGHRFQFRTKPAPGFDGIVKCQVLELDAPRRLVYSWHGGGLETMVTWTLTPSPGGTTVRLEHAGFEGVKGYLVRTMLAKGWGKMAKGSFPAVLDQLAAGLPVGRTVECDHETEPAGSV